MKKVPRVIIPVLTILTLVFIQTGCSTPTPEELKASIEIVDVETKWVKKLYKPWPQRLIIVPAISFRVKNNSDEVLRYISFNAIFRILNEPQNLGDSFFPGLQGDPVEPGGVSDVQFMKCNYGYEGKSVSGIKNNPYWKTAFVKLFIRSKGSRDVLMGEWEISRTIDFKEPEPVYKEEKKKKKSTD